ncbi:hypothetical protein MMC07_003830 [Pseudocyphellaria aurata]|nr:hypothetical protein [Pseudocyphellaria aurata]
MPSADPTPGGISQTTPHPPLPPPSTFDILPPLHALLSRLLLPAASGPTTASPLPASSPHPTNAATTPLSPKDLSTASSAVKIRIQKARVAVQRLPDINRSVQDQEREIRELEEEVSRLKGVLAALGENAREAASSPPNRLGGN